jgi:WD40 repeat protein
MYMCVELHRNFHRVLSNLQRSTDLPYAHTQSILKFVVLSGETDLNLISSGEDGTVRTWNFNTFTSSFDHIHCYEGHLRGVTGLAFNGM